MVLYDMHIIPGDFLLINPLARNRQLTGLKMHALKSQTPESWLSMYAFIQTAIV